MDRKAIVGIDTGGTFTDLAWFDPEAGEIQVMKVPSTPDDPAEATRSLLSCRDHNLASVIHGTTVATNVVLERKGADVALITTLGFRDSLEIGRTRRAWPGLFNTKFIKHAPLIPRTRRFEIDERMLADGTVLRPIDTEELSETVLQLKKLSPEVVVVCLLHSYINPTHEQTVGRVLHRELPDCPVVLSSDVVPEFREYERLSTSVINAYALPSVARYLGRLAKQTQGNLFVMGSNGGTMTGTTASNFPARTILSGPAGGVRGAMLTADAIGVRDILTCDMGGTSTDVALVKDLQPDLIQETMIAGLPLKLPQLDIQTVGAGGGSIAWVDVDGSLLVGPRSAGAVPGPACYGRGGNAVTVTDANLCLGRLGTQSLTGGALNLDLALAEDAMRKLSAEAMVPDVDQLAQGILQLVVTSMVGTLREISIERGHDPRDFTLVPFGGAGPLHATDIAREMGLSRIVIPRHPGNLSAIGLLASDIRYDLARTMLVSIDAASMPDIEKTFEELEYQGRNLLERDGFAAERMLLQRSIEMQYRGQAFALNLPVGRPLECAGELYELFAATYAKRYGAARSGQPVESVAVRISATGEVDRKFTRQIPHERGWLSAAIKERRRVHFEDGWVKDCPVYARERLGASASFAGPAIVEEFGSTTVIPLGWNLTVDELGNLRVER